MCGPGTEHGDDEGVLAGDDNDRARDSRRSTGNSVRIGHALALSSGSREALVSSFLNSEPKKSLGDGEGGVGAT